VAGYRLEEQIGRGGMAVVYRAHDERLGRAVALKILEPALAADEGFRQRFIGESRAAAAVDDPHIIPVFEAGESGPVLFIAMRYVSGGDVRSLLRRLGALPPARVAGIVSPVAAALDAAHAAGLVHRDVKPGNMLLDARPGRPDHVYLSDFGLTADALASARLTASGQFLGTVDYAAPEQAGGHHVGGQADQYALACAAFEMLCGEPPFPRELATATLLAHLSEPAPSVTAKRPGLPVGLDAVLARALAKSPGDRFPSCALFAGALRTAAGIAHYDTGERSDAGSQDRHPRTVAATPAPPARAASRDSGPPAGRSANTVSAAEVPRPRSSPGPDTAGAPGPHPVRPGPPWRWPLAITAVAAAVIAIAALILTVVSSRTSSASSPAASAAATARAAQAVTPPAVAASAAVSASPGTTAPAGTAAPPSTTGPLGADAPDDLWIAQLESIPLTASAERLDAALTAVRAQVPQAAVLNSSQYASLRPGYWVIYYAASFASGTQALTYCAEHGRTTSTQCIGRYLSHDSADFRYQCYPASSASAADCDRP
jgi:serine/threonine protein kinase